VLLLLSALAGPTLSAQERSAPPTTADLLRTGDRNAREGKYVEALLAWKRAYERRFSGFRDVPFLFPVGADFLDRAGLRKQLIDEFEKELPEEKAVRERKALAAFGLCPPDLDLKATMLHVLTEEIGGFYDPETKRLYLIKEGGGGEDGRKWWEKLLGSGGFDAEEQKMVLVHEMSHALMDQHHDLLSLQRSAEDDDDMSMAITALVEGEATLCMLVGPGSKDEMLRVPPDFMNSYMGLITPFLSFAGGSAFRRAPRVIRESLMFPYLSGMSFCLSLTSREGEWAPVDRAFDAPPLSTEVILHPERYGRDAPLAVSFPDLAGELGQGWSEVRSNVLGELVIRIFLSEKLPNPRSAKAAEGWGGDFYRLYEQKAGAGRRRSGREGGAGTGPGLGQRLGLGAGGGGVPGRARRLPGGAARRRSGRGRSSPPFRRREDQHLEEGRQGHGRLP
jgi:hypothetical protein